MATVFSNQAHLANIINCYKKQGFSKAIDDFGSGPGGGGDGGDTPVRDKAELVESLKMAIAETEHFVTIYSVDLNAIEAAEGLTFQVVLPLREFLLLRGLVQ